MSLCPVEVLKIEKQIFIALHTIQQLLSCRDVVYILWDYYPQLRQLGGTFAHYTPDNVFYTGKSMSSLLSCCGTCFLVNVDKISRVMSTQTFCMCENKDADQVRRTPKLISAFVFATRIAQSLFFIIPKFEAYSLLL